MTETTASPYADEFDTYRRRGWRGVIPLPPGRKYPPPDGFTGYGGDWPSYADCHTWADTRPDANLGIRLEPDTVGVDVDHYAAKRGGDTLTELVEQYGALPPTWLSTSRDDGISGIRFYKVPAGTRLVTALPGVELIQAHHRYAVAWPSIHPESGQQYRWINEVTGETGDPPSVDELPDLPQTWVEGLTATSEPASKVADADLTTTYNMFPTGQPCRHMHQAAGKAMQGNDRHDAYNEAVLTAAGYARRGCPGGPQIIGRLRAAFIAEVTSDGSRSRSEAEAEWRRNLAGALAIVANDSQGATCPDNIDWVTIPPSREHTANGDAPTGPLAGGVWDYALNWHEVLAGETPEPDWLIDGLLEQGRLVAIYSAAKAGKSLIALDIAASVALGKPCLGSPAARPRHVLYVDLEMTPDEVAERVRDYGHNQPDQLTERLHYLSLPSLQPMDSAEGGRAIAAAAAECGAELVVIDTASRTIVGGENDSDTWHKWYRNTGLPLKAQGCTVVRLDHAGKDKDRGQRGSSAKVSDVDLVLRLTRLSPDTILLQREEARQAHYVDKLLIRVAEDGDDVRHVVTGDVYTEAAALQLIAEANAVPLPVGGWRPLWDFAKRRGLQVSRSQVRTAARIRRQTQAGGDSE